MPSISPLAILLSNQRRMPSQWRLTVRAASMIGGSRLWVAQKYQRLQEGGPACRGWLVVEVLEGQPDLVGTRGLEMARGQTFECRALPLGQVGRIAQPDIARAAQQALPLLLGAPHLIDGVVDDLDGMELVEGDRGLGQALADALDEGRAHVDADLARSPRARRRCAVRSSAKAATVSASLPSVANSTRAWSISTNSVM